MLFRFEGLEIWKRAAVLANKLCNIADRMHEQRRFKFAQQLYSAALSMPNNIAEGSGSTSQAEFAHFLNIARRSIFENASMLIVFAKRGLTTDAEREVLLPELEELSRMVTAFSRSLNRRQQTPGNPPKNRNSDS
ncbi:MAG TPA: four helix bundle protein [Lacipirellulaceae bacterium]